MLRPARVSRTAGRESCRAVLAMVAAGVLTLATPAIGQGRLVEALPLYGDGTESFLQLDLGTGDGFWSDRLQGDPLAIRSRRMRQNLFSEIGRPTEQAAHLGEILLGPIRVATGATRAAVFVETSTGYLALFDQVGRNNQLGNVRVAIGRPFEPIASMDGNYALLMRRDSAGRTEGAYLYHATSGRGSYYGGLKKLEIDVEVATVADLPQLSGRVAAAPIQSSRQQTRSYLLADGGNGDLYFADLSGDAARVTVRKSALNLSEVFAQPGPYQGHQRFVAVPILASDDRTRHVFLVDVTSGAMALVEGVDQRPTLRPLEADLYRVLGGEPAAGPRALAAVPAVAGSGQTVGVWLLDSSTGAIAYVDNPGFPGQAAVRRVAAGN